MSGSASGGRSALVRLLLALAGAGLLVWVAGRIGWDTLGAAFTRLGLAGGAAVVALGLVESILDGLALHRVSLGRVSAVYAVAVNSAGTVVNSAIPYEAGEVAKGLLLRRRAAGTVTGLLVWNYVWKLSKPLAGVVALALGAGLSRALPPRALLAVGAGCALMFLPYVVLRSVVRARPAERLMRLGARLPRLGAAAERFVAGATRLDTEMVGFLGAHRGPFVAALALQIAGRLVGVVTVGVILATVAPDVDPWSAGALYAALSASDLVLMFIPVRLGVGESAYYVLFSALGLDPALGLIIGVVLRLRQLVANGLLSLGILVRH